MRAPLFYDGNFHRRALTIATFIGRWFLGLPAFCWRAQCLAMASL
jgi:hypothetical protein